ncbi:MAG: methyl-accepting chemotaxis protein [Nitrospiria bacterium]
MHGGLKGSFHRIGEHSESLTASSKMLTTMSHGMAGNALQTFQKARFASESANQINARVKIATLAANEMQETTHLVGKKTSEASTVVQSAVEMTDETDRIMGELSRGNAEIDSIIKLITSLAEQTNLLALNASIEAARVGEAGKGFGVVANEVKELAKETAKATDAIKQKIGFIRNHTSLAVGTVENMSQVIHQVNTLQETIAGSLEKQGMASTGLVDRLSETEAQTDEIYETITEVAQMATNTAKGADDTEEAASKLSKVAVELQNSIDQFKL